MADGTHLYDIAVSFAGAQRSLVESYVRACEDLGLRVFYDRNVLVQMWGRDFIQEFRRVYGEQTRYVVPFLSAEYLSTPYPMDEFTAALPKAIERMDDSYFLPIVVGGVHVPEHLLRSSIAFLTAEDHTVEELARHTADRVLAPEPAREALRVRLPSIPPMTFDPIGTLEAALKLVGERFTQVAGELGPYGYACHVRTSDTEVDVRVETHGTQVYGLRVGIDGRFAGDRLVLSVGSPQITGNGFNGWATAEWDARSLRAKLKFADFALLGTTDSEELLSFDEFFDRL
ncbi:TIR domain-containing protein [Umezawaea sp. NPDC059074]|uniref:TIR domain-containing protein n=1 Tax=Umezawaea sp. NPDC059074 TaxID=3346716 RepID=UPI0036C73490